MIRTPGTRIEFHDLDTWIAAAKGIAARSRQFCAATKRAYLAHWQALDTELAIAWIRAAPEPTVRRLADMLQAFDGGPWHRPPRGQRQGKWERLNMETKNRLWRLAREADHAELGLGHNSRNAEPERRPVVR